MGQLDEPQQRLLIAPPSFQIAQRRSAAAPNIGVGAALDEDVGYGIVAEE
jgi:hypothetical protein